MTHKSAADPTAANKAHLAFAESDPEWMEMANRTISLWGTGQVTLQVAIGEALKTAHGMGRLGEFPAPKEAPAVRRRLPPAPPPSQPEFVARTRAPAPAQTFLRRSRP